MMRYSPGQDVIVDFDGIEHRGEVIDHRRGDVLCIISVDMSADYGRVSAMLSPQQTVCVAEVKVRPAD